MWYKTFLKLIYSIILAVFVFNGSQAKALSSDILDIFLTPQEDHVVISWSSHSSNQFDYFIIQKSADGLAFSDVDTVFSISSENARAHSVKDYSPFEGRFYYRLRYSYLDGTISQSKIAAITFEKTVPFSFDVYPKPATSHVNLVFKGVAHDAVIETKILNLRGETMVVLDLSQANMNNNTFCFSRCQTVLNPGTYIVTGTYAGQMYWQKLVVE